MKKIYVKPRTIVIATAASELCQFSAWNTDNARSTEELETTTDWGKVIFDPGKGKMEKEEDPWDDDNW